MRRLVQLVAVLAAAVVLSTGCTSATGTHERQPAPPVVGELLDGGRYDLAEHRGEVVVINFWASWCPPCRAEIGDLEATYQATKALGVTFVGINTRDEVDKARAFVEGRASYPSVLDPAGQLALGYAKLGATTIPATVVVDRQGRVAEVIRAPVRRATFEPIVVRVAGEPRP